MPPFLALLFGWCLVGYAFWRERQRNVAVSRALIWPLLWYLATSSRPFGVWLGIWGINLPGGSGDPTEGSFIDRLFYGILTLIGLWVLSRRRIDWGRLLRENAWLVVFIGFLFVSITWSDFPYVSFKRFIKLFGSIVMALVVLTEKDTLTAVTTIIRRCAYIHLPMSIIVVRYFRQIGISWSWSGDAESWMGISTSKNVLGQVAMVAALYFLWEVIRNWRRDRWKSLNFLFFLQGVYLLKGSDDSISMTSLAVFLFGLVVFLRLGALRYRPAAVRPFMVQVMAATSALLALVTVHSVVMFKEDSLFGWVITKMGRDITLTDRTTIWSECYEVAAANPVLGVGYGGFWIGEIANIPFSEVMTWTLGQAHSGYVDTYLQTGWVGIALLLAMILAACPVLLRSIRQDFEFGRLRITLFLTILFVNITETSYLRGDHHLWFLMQVVIWSVPFVRLKSVSAGPASAARESVVPRPSPGSVLVGPPGSRAASPWGPTIPRP